MDRESKFAKEQIPRRLVWIAICTISIVQCNIQKELGALNEKSPEPVATVVNTDDGLRELPKPVLEASETK